MQPEEKHHAELLDLEQISMGGLGLCKLTRLFLSLFLDPSHEFDRIGRLLTHRFVLGGGIYH